VLLIAGVRHLMQVVAYGLLEWVATRSPRPPEIQPTASISDALHARTDGSLVEAVDALLIAAEQNGWSGAYRIGGIGLRRTKPNLV